MKKRSRTCWTETRRLTESPFIKALSSKRSIIEKAMYSYFSENDVYHRELFKCMKYPLEAGGKRLRPAIMLFMWNILGSRNSKILPAACSLEMIHTYSLIHDDLPSMDNDDFRRGKYMMKGLQCLQEMPFFPMHLRYSSSPGLSPNISTGALHTFSIQ